MFQQVPDFLDESEALFHLISPLSDEQLAQPTQFEKWTINDILTHLHMWNWAANEALNHPESFKRFINKVVPYVMERRLRVFEDEWLKGLAGADLRDTWRAGYLKLAEDYASADPKARIKWAGPDMSIRSSMTARLMETWAHGQAIYDLLGEDRVDTDRIKNIVILGINTFGWSFKNRGQEIPGKAPRLQLNSPSGELWVFNETSDSGLIEGNASEFCQVVSQTRNVADTALKVDGDTAQRWMAIAQCFAGPAEDPPQEGVRVG